MGLSLPVSGLEKLNKLPKITKFTRGIQNQVRPSSILKTKLQKQKVIQHVSYKLKLGEH